jgi:uncharacterized membrane protein
MAQRGDPKPRKGSRRGARRGRSNATAERTAGDHAREAVAEWGRAARLGTQALSVPLAKARAAYSTKRGPRSLADKLNPTKTKKGGPAGDVADESLAKLGGGGKLASFLSLGSRILDRVLPKHLKRYAGNESVGDGHPTEGTAAAAGTTLDGGIPIPIQESMDVAASVASVYDLSIRFEEYTEFIPRIHSVERVAENKLELVATIMGSPRQLGIEVVEARPRERIDWRSIEGIRHSGAVTFHELAPRLTHVEVSIDLELHDPLDRLARHLRLTDRAIRTDMHRLKAYAELYEDAESEVEEPPEEPAPESGEPGDEAEPQEAEPQAQELAAQGETEERREAPQLPSDEEDEPDTESIEPRIRRRAVAGSAQDRR